MAGDSLTEFAFLLATQESELARLVSRTGDSSTARGRDGQSPNAFAAHLDEDALLKMSEKLRAGEWEFISYRERLIPKSFDVPPRRLSVPAARDRVPLQVLKTSLSVAAPQARRDSPQHVTRRFIRAARETGFGHVTRLDLRSFYPNVNHEAIERELNQHVAVTPVREMLMRAIRTPTLPDHASARDIAANARGVPQGLPISNGVAELVMAEFDAARQRDDDLRYFRYADDMIFLTRRDKHQQIYKRVRADLVRVGLSPHPFIAGGKSQWTTVDSGVDFLGYHVSSDRVSVKPSGVHRIKRSLALTLDRFKNERNSSSPGVRLLATPRLDWFLNLRITGCFLDKESRGWVQYYALLDDFGLLRELDHFVTKILSAYGASEAVTPRSFVKTYRAWARRADDISGYVPNFDLYTLDQQKQVLAEVFGISEARMFENGDVWVASEFSRRARTHVRTMDRDLTPNY